MGLWLALLKAVGIGKNHHLDTRRVLSTKLLGCRGRKVRHLLGKLLDIGYLLAKTAGNAYRLLSLDSILKLNARHTSQLLPSAQTHDAEQSSHQPFVHLRKLPSGGDTSLVELACRLATDAPDILYRKLA